MDLTYGMSSLKAFKIFLKSSKYVDHANTSVLSWCKIKNLHTSTYFKSANKSKPLPKFSLYSNPVDRLQPLIQIPIIPENDTGFRPSEEEIMKGADLFTEKNYKGQDFEFVGSYPNPHIMPKNDSVPEVCFIGKSNVGKSSLLSKMFSESQLKVRTSSQPGSTKLMNMFNVGGLLQCVDMPGYGFNMPDHFELSVEAYLESRRSTMNFLLIDGSYPMNNTDMKYFMKYGELGLPLTIVVTKIDLPKPGNLIRNLGKSLKFREVSKANGCFPQPFLVSSVTGEGVAFLQSFIAYVTGNLQIESLK